MIRHLELAILASNLVTEQPLNLEALQNVAIVPENIKGTHSGNDIPGSAETGTTPRNGISVGAETGSDVFETVEKLPMFPGRAAAFSRFLSNNLLYPDRVGEESVSGKVLVSFIVEKDGTLTDFEISRKETVAR